MSSQDWTRGLSVKKCKKILSAKGIDFSSVVEKGDLLSLVRANATEVEAKKLLEAKPSVKKKTKKTAQPPSSSTLPSQTNDQYKQAAAQMQNMSPEQLRYQAKAMRRDPSMVRRRNAQMANMSDQQIRAAADQMEHMADNPQQMEEMRKAMQNMTPEQVEQIKKMQASLTPEQLRSMQNMKKTYGKSGKSGKSPANLEKMAADMTDEQIGAMLTMLKENPAGARTLLRSQPALAPYLKGISDEVLDAQLAMFAKMDAKTLRKLLSASQTLQTVGKPVVAVFKKVDTVTGGYAKHIMLVLVAILLYYIVGFIWSCFCWFWGWGQYSVDNTLEIPETSSTVQTAGVSGSIDNENEFAEFDDSFDF